MDALQNLKNKHIPFEESYNCNYLSLTTVGKGAKFDTSSSLEYKKPLLLPDNSIMGSTYKQGAAFKDIMPRNREMQTYMEEKNRGMVNGGLNPKLFFVSLLHHFYF